MLAFNSRESRALLEAFINYVNSNRLEECLNIWHPYYVDKVRLYWRSLGESHRGLKIERVRILGLGDECYVISADLRGPRAKNVRNRYGIICRDGQAYLCPSQALLRQHLSKDWRRAEGEHVVVVSRQPAEANTADQWAQTIKSELGITHSERITYYLCSDSEQVALLAGTTGCPGAITDGWTGDVVAPRIPDVHEIAHSISVVFGLGWPPHVLREGLAEYFDPEPYMADMLKAQYVIPIDELFVAHPDVSQYPAFFPEARAFVTFVMQRYGVDHLLRLYAVLGDDEDNVSRVASVLGEPPDVFRRAWDCFLASAICG